VFAICKATVSQALHPYPVGARVADVGLGGPLWSPAVPLKDIDPQAQTCFMIFGGIVHGGDEGARTPDLDSAIVALSQLSYIPRQARS
jgi:hypothetical protein